jgi:hypothetical protein
MKAQNMVATIVGTVGFITFTVLLATGLIQALSYAALLALLGLVCLTIPVLHRLKNLDIKNLKLTLERIEETKKEISAKEKDFKLTALLLAELIAATATVSNVFGDEESDEYSKALVRRKIQQLANHLRFTDNQLTEIFKYEEALKEVRTASKENLDEAWTRFKALLRGESEKGS